MSANANEKHWILDSRCARQKLFEHIINEGAYCTMAMPKDQPPHVWMQLDATLNLNEWVSIKSGSIIASMWKFPEVFKDGRDGSKRILTNAFQPIQSVQPERLSEEQTSRWLNFDIDELRDVAQQMSKPTAGLSNEELIVSITGKQLYEEEEIQTDEQIGRDDVPYPDHRHLPPLEDLRKKGRLELERFLRSNNPCIPITIIKELADHLGVEYLGLGKPDLAIILSNFICPNSKKRIKEWKTKLEENVKKEANQPPHHEGYKTNFCYVDWSNKVFNRGGLSHFVPKFWTFRQLYCSFRVMICDSWIVQEHWEIIELKNFRRRIGLWLLKR